MQQRLFSSLHEGFYCYFMFFIISFILTVRFDEKLPKKNALVENPSKEEEAEVEKKNN